MGSGIYSPKHETHALEVTGGSEYYFWAPKGTPTYGSRWKIVKMEWAGNNWIEKYPVDTQSGLGSDAAKFKKDDYLTYTYAVLGTNQT